MEIIFAEDGSTDGTLHAIEGIAGVLSCPVQILHAGQRLGKGGGFRNGFLQAKGNVVILYDCDLSVSPSQLENLVNAMSRGVDIVMGCRNAQGSRVLSYPTITRFIYARVLYLLAKLLFFSLPFKETQCGFKAFNKGRVLPIIKSLEITGWLFDLELLLKARYHGLRIVELPVVYRYLASSKIHNVKDPARVFHDLLRLRGKVLPFSVAPRRNVKKAT